MARGPCPHSSPRAQQGRGERAGVPGGTSWLAVRYFLSENIAVQNLIITLMSSRSLFSPWVGNLGGQLQTGRDRGERRRRVGGPSPGRVRGAPEVVKGGGVDLLAEHVADGGVGQHVRVQQGQAEGQQPTRGAGQCSVSPAVARGLPASPPGSPGPHLKRGPMAATCRFMLPAVPPMLRDRERCRRLQKISTWSELQYLAISKRCTRNWAG